MRGVRIRDLLARLELEIPAAWAEPWDRVGLLVGDPDAEVRRVFASLDQTPVSLAAAINAGAQVLITHHPAFLESPSTLSPAAGIPGVPFAAASAGVALIAAHTNLDRSPGGADALPGKLGLTPSGPLERSTQPCTGVVTYVPVAAADRLREALLASGAGRIGMYAGCSFESAGTGRYTPLPGSSPALGEAAGPVSADELRVEAVCPTDMAAAVIGALRAAHPYEEPVVLATPSSLSRGAARMGRICVTPAGSTLGSFASMVSDRLGVHATVWGDPARPVRSMATAPGSGRSLVPAAVSAGIDVLVTGELRYHEALDALASGLCVIEAGHDATEWPMVPVLAAIASRTPGLTASSVIVDDARAEWWTAGGS